METYRLLSPVENILKLIKYKRAVQDRVKNKMRKAKRRQRQSQHGTHPKTCSTVTSAGKFSNLPIVGTILE